MATSGGTGQGPGTKPIFKKSWVQVVGGSLPSSWKKNIGASVRRSSGRQSGGRLLAMT